MVIFFYCSLFNYRLCLYTSVLNFDCDFSGSDLSKNAKNQKREHISISFPFLFCVFYHDNLTKIHTKIFILKKNLLFKDITAMIYYIKNKVVIFSPGVYGMFVSNLGTTEKFFFVFTLEQHYIQPSLWPVQVTRQEN